jgi:hypothetical protein
VICQTPIFDISLSCEALRAAHRGKLVRVFSSSVAFSFATNRRTTDFADRAGTERIVMGSVLSPTESGRNGTGPGTQELRKQVRSLISSLLYDTQRCSERRRQLRYAFAIPVFLTPLGDDGLTPIGEAIMAIGKDLSESGLGFYHVTPLRWRRMIVSLQIDAKGWVAFLIEMKRSRPIRKDWYESGGRFLECVPLPPNVSSHNDAAG